jgi:septum site-determining protein MinC
MAASGAHKGAAFELKGRMATLSVMRVLHADVDTLLTQLDARLAQAPGFFDGMPLVIAPAESVSLEPAALIALVDGLKARGLTPVAAAECTPEQAAQAGLGVLRNLESSPSKPAAQRSGRDSATAANTRLITSPVRSGQQIYARGGDLVITAAVGAGAEVMADGHIHVYGSLRGRALAGVQGDTNARIFCRSLHAELVAIAGHYRLSEQIEAGLIDASVMIALQGDDLQLSAL